MTAFRSAVESGDPQALSAALHDDVRFSSPAVFAPYEGRAAVMTVLRAVFVVFEDFHYTATYDSADGHVLRFAARVGERSVDGVDILRVDADGLVTELTVMIRPLSALTAVAAAMGAQLQTAP